MTTEPDQRDAPVTLCVLLWARPGQETALAAYEDAVLALVPEHRGRLLTRVRRTGDDPAQAHEIQVLRFEDQAALDAYLADPRRAARTDERDAAIERTELIPVEVV